MAKKRKAAKKKSAKKVGKEDFSKYWLALVAVVAIVGIVWMVSGGSCVASEDDLAGEAYIRNILERQRTDIDIKTISISVPRGFECKDTDGGINYVFPGEILGTNYKDECLEDNKLIEYSCSNGKIESNTVYCYNTLGEGTCHDYGVSSGCENMTWHEKSFSESLVAEVDGF